MKFDKESSFGGKEYIYCKKEWIKKCVKFQCFGGIDFEMKITTETSRVEMQVVVKQNEQMAGGDFGTPEVVRRRRNEGWRGLKPE